jgi:hypothetical protein
LTFSFKYKPQTHKQPQLNLDHTYPRELTLLASKDSVLQKKTSY